MSMSNVHDAKTNLSKLIEAALRGEEVIIAKAGKPVVRLVAIEHGFLTPGETFKRAIGMFAGQWLAAAGEEWADSDRYVMGLFEASLNKE